MTKNSLQATTAAAWAAISLASPTYALVTLLKRLLGEKRRTNLLRIWSWTFTGSIAAATIALISSQRYGHDAPPVVYIALALVAWSRINEIILAFVSDGADTLEKKPRVTTFTPVHRLRFVFLSYLEIIIDFGILFYGLQLLFAPPGSGTPVFDAPLPDLSDAVFLSSTIVTTVGYGPHAPAHALTRLLSIYEILSGFALFVFALAVYTGAEHHRPPGGPAGRTGDPRSSP